MTRQRTLYKLVGRYAIGNDTVYYALISENGKEVRYTEEQMAFVVGREQVINVKAQLYKDKILFRGLDCDIRNLPTIQLNNSEINNTNNSIHTNNTSKASSCNKNSNNDIINAINERIDSLLLSRYSLLENFSIEKKLNDNKLYIKLIENRDYCDKDNLETCFCIVSKDNYIYIVSNNEILHKSSISKIDKFIEFTLSCICIVKTDIYNGVHAATDFPDSITEAFNDYSGASNYMDDVLRKVGTKYCDAELAPYSMIHACLMCLAYDSKKETRTYEGYLFRGERGFTDKSHIEHGFTSLTYSLNVAREFSNNNEGSRILAFKNLRLNNLVEMGNIAVCLDNGEQSEHEVLLRPEVKIEVHEKIGIYKGVPIYLATAEPTNSKIEEIHYIVNTFLETYKTDCIYGVGYILKNIGKIHNIETDSCDYATVYTKSGDSFDLDISTDKFIINDDEIVGRDNIINIIKSMINM